MPNALYTIKELGIWDIIYEHCGYFTAGSLANAMRLAGFRVEEVTPAYDGQFLGAHGRVAATGVRETRRHQAPDP